MTIATTISGDVKRHKEVSEGNVWCCGEYAECEYLIDVLSIANLEIGLQWLHDSNARETKKVIPSPLEEVSDFRARFPDPRPRILATLSRHCMACTCSACAAAYAENVSAVAQGHRLADALEKAIVQAGVLGAGRVSYPLGRRFGRA